LHDEGNNVVVVLPRGQHHSTTTSGYGTLTCVVFGGPKFWQNLRHLILTSTTANAWHRNQIAVRTMKFLLSVGNKNLWNETKDLYKSVISCTKPTSFFVVVWSLWNLRY